MDFVKPDYVIGGPVQKLEDYVKHINFIKRAQLILKNYKGSLKQYKSELRST